MSSLTANARIYIGQAVDDDIIHAGRDLTADDYAAQLWAEIERPVDLGRLIYSGEATSRGGSRGGGQRTRTKIARSVGSLEPRFALADNLPGQAALYAAEATDLNYAFRIVFAGGAQRLFCGVVGGLAELLGGQTDQPHLAAEIWINSNVLRLAAAPAA